MKVSCKLASGGADLASGDACSRGDGREITTDGSEGARAAAAASEACQRGRG